MKLYCIINDKRYEIVEGATFAEEYNETLDSGTIMLDQVTKIENLEPFDDVYIYDDETNGNLFYKHMLIDTFNEELNNLNFGNDSVYVKLYKYKIQLFSETKRLEKVILPNISITQPVDKNRRRSVWEYLNVYLDLYSPKIKIISNDFTWNYKNKYSFSNFHDLPDEYEEVEFLQSTGTQWIRTGLQIQEGDRIVIEFNDFESNGKYICGQNDQETTGNPYFQIGGSSLSPMWNLLDVSQHKTGSMYEFVFTKVNNPFNGYFGLFCTTYNDGPLGSGAGSGKIYYIRQYRDNILISNLIPCKRKSDDVLGFYDLVDENHTFYTNMGTGEFLYENKRHPAHFNYNSVHDLFADVDAPEMSLTNPTLRDVISQLMLTKDCIPVVHDDVIDYIDVSQRHGEFKTDPEYVNFIHSGMTSEEFATEARREYSGALSQENTCKMIEYLGFRNSESALLRQDDLVLETRYPIYKINKIYMCYYKKAQIYDPDPNHLGNYFVRFMCKQDITDLVIQNVTRQALSLDPEAFRDLVGTSSQPVDIQNVKIEDVAKFKICTVGFNIGSNRITGWSEKYTFFTDTAAWFKSTQTVLENIIGYCDKKTPYGYKKAGIVVSGDQYVIDTGTDGLTSIDTGNVYSNASISQKAVFFEVDYNAMFGGAIVHSKDFKDKDDLTTADNCSSSLTVLEADGLFEKEKMNRLGNRQYNIQARYEGTNAYSIMNGSTCNHILGSVYDDDVVIYHKEYQIYNNVILANYTGTFDYVLKNYFTSVYAKLRTYNLASYDESVVRAENYKEYIILSDEKATFENNTLMYGNLLKYISCFSSPFSDLEPFKESIRNQINFAYIQNKFNGSDEEIDKSKAFCDINTFCSGYSMCVNLKMYDNVTQGVYIENPNVSNENMVGSSQEWSIAVDDVEDAFQEKMAFGFGHLYQEDDDIPSTDLDPDGNIKTPFVSERAFDIKPISDTSASAEVASIYNNKLLKLPNFNDQKYIEKNSYYTIGLGSKNGLVIYKDNKEVLDYTFQFETITNNKNIFFSSYFTKLTDMSGTYQKYYSTGIYNQYWGRTTEYSFPFEIEWFAEMSDSKHGKLVLYLTVQKSLFVDDYSPYELNMNTEGREISKSPNIPINYTVIPIGIINYFRADYRQFWVSGLTIDSNNNATIRLSRSDRRRQCVITLTQSETTWMNDETQTGLPDINLQVYQQDSTYYYFKAEIETIEIHPNVDMKILNPERLNSVVSLTAYTTQSTTQEEEYLKQQRLMTKNMFAIISTEEIKKEIIYDSYLTSYTSGADRKTFSGINVLGLPSHMTIVNTDDSSGEIEKYPYIAFKDMFSFVPVSDDTSIPAGTYILYDIISFPDFAVNLNAQFHVVLRDPNTGIQETKYFSGISFENGIMKYIYRYTSGSVDVYDTENGWVDVNYQYMIIEASGYDYSTDFKVWLENNTDDYDYANIPTIHVGNHNLRFYPGNSIRSIQYWYLDNNGEGAGRLHFVFGVNIEPGQYQKDIYVSVATKRSPYVYTQDHKHIIGKIKQMNALNYAETNEIDLNGGGDVYLNEPIVTEEKLFLVSIFVDNQFFNKIRIDANQDIYYISDSGENVLVYENGEWVKEAYKHILLIGSEFREDEDFVEWLLSSSYEQFTVENAYVGQNAISFKSVNEDSILSYNKPVLEFSRDRISWEPYVIGRNLILEENEKVYFRGQENNVFWVLPTSGSGRGVSFEASQNFNVSGRLMSLVDKTSEKTTLSQSTDEGVFYNLFKGCTTLIDAHDLVMGATTLSYYCYSHMFDGCTSLVRAPSVLPALNLNGRSCYEYMFANCTSLTSAPELAFTSVSGRASCAYMFYNCESLTTAPDILATNTTQECYYYMFYKCTNLTSTPQLSAVSLSQSCYLSMFGYCENLTTINIDFKNVTSFGVSCCEYMFHHCTSLTSSPAIGSANSTTSTHSFFYMFWHCEALTQLGYIYPKNLTSGCCEDMFSYCTSLEVSSSQTEEFIYAYPFTATPGGTYSFQLYMFEDTAGPYTGGGALGTTYYLKFAPIE